EAGSGAAGVVEGELAGRLERAGLGDADERAVERPAGERAPDALVLAGGQDQRQRRRSLAQVGAGNLAGLDRLSRAVEDVVGDLEGDPEREPELAEARVSAAAEQARGLEQLPGLERTAGQVVVDARVRVVGLRALERLASGQGEGRAGQALHRGAVAGRGEFGECPGEQVVAGRARRFAWTRGEKDEQRAQPLATGRKRFAADLGDEPWIRADRVGQAQL